MHIISTVRFRSNLRYLRMIGNLKSLLFAVLIILLTACGGGGSGGASALTSHHGSNAGPPSAEASPLQEIISQRGLTGDPAASRGLVRVEPNNDPKVKLGQLLFFSTTLSGNFDVSCASCHHPDLVGADALSLSVGVAPEDATKIGLDRQVDTDRDIDPAADGGPNMPRNSPTVFNSALYDRALGWAGRAYVLDEVVTPGGEGQAIHIPESGNLPQPSEANGLMEVFSKIPLVNNNEMRGYSYKDISTLPLYRQRLIERLRGEKDQDHMDIGASERWLGRFQTAFDEPNASADQIVTLLNVQKAMTAYIKSMIFVDTPWQSYLQGEKDAISASAKRGALDFLGSRDNGGLGCAACHSGDRFTDEHYYNMGFPQLGRGFRQDGTGDIGRWLNTRKDQDRYAFRTPSLLNVAKTAPYGHDGAFATLPALLQYHANPIQGFQNFDFNFPALEQIQASGVSYPQARDNTLAAQQADSFQQDVQVLPQRPLTDQEVSDLVAFLDTLTDRCVAELYCRDQWVPSPNEDPDGNMLIRNQNPEPVPVSSPIDGTDNYPSSITLNFPSSQSALPTFKELGSCSGTPSSAPNTGQETLVPSYQDPAFGLVGSDGKPLKPHGFSLETWGGDNVSAATEPTMIAGGLTGAYLDGDCWPDLAYAGGEDSGMVLYHNRGEDQGFSTMSLLDDDPGGDFTGVASADLNGDYRPELLFGNLHQGDIPIYTPLDDGTYQRVAALPMSRNTYGISFGDYDGDGYPELYLAHWFGLGGTFATAPVFWTNDAGNALVPSDAAAHLSTRYIDQNFNFTPKFADLNGDGTQDLVVSSDFGTSMVLQNMGDGTFQNITDRNVITDENGMGGALGDYDNDGDLDWFVTSVKDPNGKAEANWGVTGNRLYRNDTPPRGTITFKNVTQQAGVADGNWGWGACFADFNNDGFLDIFHVNGFGYIPGNIYPPGSDQAAKDNYATLAGEFIHTPPRLFINQGDGTFQDDTAAWGVTEGSEGRGLTCMDYDRDGDIDVGLLDQSTGLQFFTNQSGHGPGHHFLSVRLVGKPPNTNALGARVHLTADVGNGHGTQTQLRMSQANSNFNSQNPPDLHFGLGQADTVDNLTIDWPDGTEWQCHNLAANHFLVFDQRKTANDYGCFP